MLRSLINLGVRDDTPSRAAKHVRVTNLVALAGIFPSSIYVAQSFAMGHPGHGALNALFVALFFGTLFLNRAGMPMAAAIHQHLVSLAAIWWFIWLLGYDAGAPLFFFPVVLGPFLTLEMRHLRPIVGLTALTALQLPLATALRASFPARLQLMELEPQRLLNASLVSICFCVVTVGFFLLYHRVEDELDEARARADALLLNVLPASVAARLKADPDARVAERVEITVMFADLVGFTPMSARVPPDAMVDLLNEVFSAFDEICDRAGVEKIRTIGDGYMAVAGAPAPRPDHALVMARVACEIRDRMADWPVVEGERLEVRIGLNSGEAIAGIVGNTRFHYDLWGDAVNVAARMESLGAPGRIHIGQPTWEQIRDEIPCESRGAIEVKGKGSMETWFL